MFSCTLGALLALTTTALAARIPGGHDVNASCITRLANGAVYRAKSADATCVDALQASESQAEAPQVQIYAADVHLESTEPLTSFLANWVVPALPARHGFGGAKQVVYFWPGFKATQPEMGFPVLQPVLEYAEHAFPSWTLQSWFVDANSGNKFPVVTAPPVKVVPGDQITSFMTFDAASKIWTVSGTNKRTGDNSTLHIAYESAGDTTYDYAMLVNENINVNEKCSLMPAATNVTFTDVFVNGKKLPGWTTRANCAGNPQCDCGNAATVNPTTGDVTLSWSTKK